MTKRGQADILWRLEAKIDHIEEKIDRHIERIAVIEEHSRTNRSALSLVATVLITIVGWVVYKLKIGL